MQKRTKHVLSPDNWYPKFLDGTVEVWLGRDPGKGDRCWRVSVWGDDDFGLEKGQLTVSEGFDLFRSIVDGVTQQQLKQLGFIPA